MGGWIMEMNVVYQKVLEQTGVDRGLYIADIFNHSTANLYWHEQ